MKLFFCFACHNEYTDYYLYNQICPETALISPCSTLQFLPELAKRHIPLSGHDTRQYVFSGCIYLYVFMTIIVLHVRSTFYCYPVSASCHTSWYIAYRHHFYVYSPLSFSSHLPTIVITLVALYRARVGSVAESTSNTIFNKYPLPLLTRPAPPHTHTRTLQQVWSKPPRSPLQPGLTGQARCHQKYQSNILFGVRTVVSISSTAKPSGDV